jgi:hypothetical protein
MYLPTPGERVCEEIQAGVAGHGTRKRAGNRGGLWLLLGARRIDALTQRIDVLTRRMDVLTRRIDV